VPNRIIRDSITTSPTLDKLSAEAECLFYRLLTQADDHGRFMADPMVLIASCYPLRARVATCEQMTAWVGECQQAGLVVLYEHDERVYGHFPSWRKHNRVRAVSSKYPPPNDNICQHVQTSANTCEHMPTRANICGLSESESECGVERSDIGIDSEAYTSPHSGRAGGSRVSSGVVAVFAGLNLARQTFAAARSVRLVAYCADADGTEGKKRRKQAGELVKLFGGDAEQARRAARNLVLSAHHRGENEQKRRYLELSYVLRHPETYLDLCPGDDEEFKRKAATELKEKFFG